MKKILLTTALVSSSLFASAAIANPTVTIGGFIDFQAGITDQDSTHETGANSRDAKFQNDTEVHVKVDGTTESGLEYGAVIELEADVTSDADNQGLNSDKTYIYVGGDFGRVELGANKGVADRMKVDASTIARATGGIDGDFYDFISISTVGSGSFIYTPDLPTAQAKGVAEDSTKISYLSPRFSGVQFGISYSPDQGDVGTAAGFSGEAGGDQENVFGVGVNYVGEYNNDLTVETSFTGEWGTAETGANEDLQAWAVGVIGSYRQFSVGGSYADWYESGQAVGAANSDSDFWTIGAAYENGPAGISATYLDSEYAGTNEFTNFVLGADYQLAPGLVPYVEVSFFELDAGAGATNTNDGSVFLIGTELTF